MKRCFKELATYIKLYDGYRKPKLNFQEMYKLFPQFTFEATKDFGSYQNFGEAFEAKNYNMIVTDETGKHQAMLVYKEYGDADENTAYLMTM